MAGQQLNHQYKEVNRHYAGLPYHVILDAAETWTLKQNIRKKWTPLSCGAGEECSESLGRQIGLISPSFEKSMRINVSPAYSVRMDY